MRQTFSTTLNVIFLTVAALIASTNNAFAKTENCVNATSVELDSIHRGDAGEGTEIIRVDIPSAGVAAFDITVPTTAEAEPKIGFLGRRCSRSADPDAAIIEKGIARQTIAFRTAGEYYFRIAAQDPNQALGSHQIHTRFIPAATYDDAFETSLGNDRGSATVRQTDFYFGSASRQEPALSLFAVYESTANNLEDPVVDPDPSGLQDPVVDPDPSGLEDPVVDPDPSGLAGTRIASTRDLSGLQDPVVDPDPSGLQDPVVDPDPSGLEDPVVDPDPSGFAGNSIGSSRGISSLDDPVVDPDPSGLEDPVVDPDPSGLEDPVVDPDPSGFAGSSIGSSRGISSLEDPVVDPDPSGLEDPVVDPDPSGLAGGGRILDSMVMVHSQDSLDVDFCQGREADDHQDVFACATTLTLDTPVTGQLSNDWQDDTDVFSIDLASPTSLQIATQSHGDTIGALYDASGQLLATDDDSGDGSNFRIVRSLPAGRFFVRVEGGGSEIAYALTIETLEW